MSEQSETTAAAIEETRPVRGADDSVSDDAGVRPAGATVDVGRIIEATVTRVLSSLGITPEAAQQQRADLEKIVAPLARAPDEIKARLDSVCSMLVERLEDPKGLVLYNLQRRLFLDLLALRDLISDLELGAAGDDGSPHLANYRNLNEQLVQLLAMNGVTPIVAAIGAQFSAQQHRVVRVVQTDDLDQDGCIDSIVRQGFGYGSFVVRPTEVVVRKGQR